MSAPMFQDKNSLSSSQENDFQQSTNIITPDTNLLPIICEAIAVHVSNDHRWVAKTTIRKYIERYFYLYDDNLYERLLQSMKEMEMQHILISKKQCVSFYSSQTLSDYTQMAERKKMTQKETNIKKSKDIGKEVIITKSGRLSYVHNDNLDDF